MRVDLFNRSVTLMDAVTIAGAAAGVLSQIITDAPSFSIATFQVKFLYGSGGTILKVWLQTSFDKGVTWMDIACAAFTTAAATKMFSVTSGGSGAYVPTDATLADDTVKDGLIGNAFRVKYTSTGTYAGATSLSVYGTFRSGIY